MTDTPQPVQRPPIPQGSESLEVWSVLETPWKKLGTVIRNGGRNGTITCTPPDLDCLLNWPRLLGYDAMNYLTGWCNTAGACWPTGTAPGAPEPLSRDSVDRGQLATRGYHRGQLATRGYNRGQKPSVSMLAVLVRRVSYVLWKLT